MADTDVMEFQELSRSKHPANLEQALSLVRGPLLADIDARPFPWLETARERFVSDCATVVCHFAQWPRQRALTVVSDFMADSVGTLAEVVGSEQETSEPVLPGGASIELALADRYKSKAPGLRTLAQLVVPSSQPYYDAAVALELSDGNRDGEYQLSYQVEITAALDEFVIALTTRASLTDLLLAECPDISDSFTCSNDQGRARFAQGVANGGDDSPLAVWCLRKNASGATQRIRVPLVASDEPGISPLLRRLEPRAATDVVLLRGTLPGAKGSTKRVAYRIRDPLMKTAEHYAFWVADRPTYVERIRIDASAFTPEVHVHPMLGNIAHEWEWRDQRCDVSVDNWVVKNQGVFLTW